MLNRRGPVLFLTAALALIALGASTQEWIRVTLVGGGVHSVTGSEAAAGIAPMCLALVALVAALSLAKRRGIAVLGVLQALLGVGLVGIMVVVLADPISASGAVVGSATGVAGRSALGALVVSSSVMGWPYVSIVAASLAAILGCLVVIKSAVWTNRPERHGVNRDVDPTDSIATWDRLSRGADPTQSETEPLK